MRSMDRTPHLVSKLDFGSRKTGWFSGHHPFIYTKNLEVGSITYIVDQKWKNLVIDYVVRKRRRIHYKVTIFYFKLVCPLNYNGKLYYSIYSPSFPFQYSKSRCSAYSLLPRPPSEVSRPDSGVDLRPVSYSFLGGAYFGQ